MINYFLKILLFLFVLSSVGCGDFFNTTKHYSKTDFDIELLNQSKKSLFTATTNEIGYITKESLPLYIKALNPIRVQKTKDGVYIQLKESFVEENGLFFPIRPVKLDEYGDPSYKHIGLNIYSYYISG